MSKRYVRLLVLILSYLSLVQAAAYDKQGIAGRRVVRTGNRQKGHKGQKGQAEGQLQGSVLIVTETVRETVTAGSGVGVNGTIAAETVTETVTVTQKENAGALPGTGNVQLSFVTTTIFGTGSPSTVTITALPETITQTIAATVTQTVASTLTKTIAQTITSLQVVASTETVTQIQSVTEACSSSQEVPGVVAGAPAGTAAPASDDNNGLPRASGGVGVTTVSIPAALHTSTLEVPPPPAATVPTETSISVSSASAEVPSSTTTTADVVASSTSSAAELASSTSTTAAEEVITTSTTELTSSTTELATSSTELLTSSTEIASSTAPAVAITSVVSVEAPSSTSVVVPAGAEPTSVLVLPAVSAANPTTTAVAPGVANGGIQFTLDVSGLSLTNVLDLGNLVPPTAAARP